MYGRNPFEDDDDDEYSFASQAKKNNAIASSGGGFKSNGSTNPFEEEETDGTFGPRKTPSSAEDAAVKRQMLIQNSMNRQLESTTRCLATIYDTEAIGVATAEELVQQGEKLDNVERNVEKILDHTKESQKHLNSIKSVFGSFKNWLSGEGKKSTASQSSAPVKNRSNSELTKVLASTSSRKEDHPAVKSYDVKGFYDTEVAEFKDYDPDSFGRSSSGNEVGSTAGGQVGSVVGHATKANTWNEYEKGLENNLNLMSNGLSNLKSLAMGMNAELTAQNDQLDRINTKVDRSDVKIRNQNMQMRRILGK